eukprot:9495238-Pyramimonas_sp.AAC.1
MIDQCMRSAAGHEIPDKTITSVLDACHHARLRRGPAEVLCSNGGGTLNRDTARDILEHGGTQLSSSRTTRRNHIIQVWNSTADHARDGGRLKTTQYTTHLP